MMSNSQFEELMKKLDTLIKLAALNAVQNKSMAEAILTLSDIGFGNTEIAKTLGTTPNYVSKVKYEYKKGKTTKLTKEIEFHPEDLHDVLSNSTMFPSTLDLRAFAQDIFNQPFNLPLGASKHEIVNNIISMFQSSDRRKQALFIQALEHRATAHELKDTQFLKFFEGWESHIKG